jgi:EAL domain-containing protein (putative c-di-GMP-specific phosphodiesterase class I)
MQRHNSFRSRLATPVAYVADSEAHSRTCVVEALLEQGFVCRDFTRASDLLDAFEARTPDLIVMDVSLQEFDSVAALRSLEASRFEGSILPIGEHEFTLGERWQQLRRNCGLQLLPCVAKPLRLKNFEASLDHVDAPPVGTEVVVDIEEAIRNGWISLWYQPKVDLSSLSVCGAEALVRVLHPRLGLIPPSRFLPESTDPKMRLLSHFVVEQAFCDWGTLLERRSPLEIAINLPLRLLLESQFVRFFRNRLPIHPRFSGVVVDVDDVGASDRADALVRLAAELRKLRIRLSVHDLTCCPPSIAEGEDFPFSEIKLGRQFVSGCAADNLKRALCRNVVEIAQRFGARSVAVGVETREDLAAVRDLGFERAQGFFFGRPMPPQELALLIATRRGGFRNLQNPKLSM